MNRSRGSGRYGRRTMIGTILAAIPTLAIAGAVYAGDVLFGRKLRNRCCIPDHDYSHQRFRPPVSGSSLRLLRSFSRAEGSTLTADADRVSVPRSTLVETPPGLLALFQIEPATLRIDHCAVSQIVVTIADSGEWHVNFTAQQDPRLVSAVERPQFERFLRNEFRLEVRPILVMSESHDPDVAALGRPELAAIPAQEFWLEKEEVRRLALRGDSGDLRRYFADIEQVHVHFSYR